MANLCYQPICADFTIDQLSVYFPDRFTFIGMYGFLQENYQIQKKHNKEFLIGYGIWLFTYTETGLDGKSDLKNHGVKPKSLSRRQL